MIDFEVLDEVRAHIPDIEVQSRYDSALHYLLDQIDTAAAYANNIHDLSRAPELLSNLSHKLNRWV